MFTVREWLNEIVEEDVTIGEHCNEMPIEGIASLSAVYDEKQLANHAC